MSGLNASGAATLGMESEVSVITNVRLGGPGREFLASDDPVDVSLSAGVIQDIAPVGTLPRVGAVLDGSDTWVIPGLWDNHVHAVQWALASQRTPLDDTLSARHAAQVMASVTPGSDGRRIGTGFRDALWPDHLELAVLDEVTGGVPTYLINSDVHSVWLNSAALLREGFDAADGVLREGQAFEISRRLSDLSPAVVDQEVIAAGRAAAARGVTGIVDFEMTWSVDAWQRRVATGFRTQRVEVAVYPGDLRQAMGRHLRSGSEIAETAGLVRMGSLKIITDGSLGTRTAACSHPYGDDPQNFGLFTVPPTLLREVMRDATAAGLRVAAHGIGDRAVTEILDAFAMTGATGTLEHAQLVRHSDLARFARLGVTASIQPRHALDDRDIADEYWSAQTAVPFPAASLLDRGAKLAFGSDAPVAPLDPWLTLSAARDRTAEGRVPWHPEERISIRAALEASTRGSVRPGDPADLVLSAQDPALASTEELSAMQVRATLVDGVLTHLH